MHANKNSIDWAKLTKIACFNGSKEFNEKKLPIIQGEISSKMFENAISALILLHFLP